MHAFKNDTQVYYYYTHTHTHKQTHTELQSQPNHLFFRCLNILFWTLWNELNWTASGPKHPSAEKPTSETSDRTRIWIKPDRNQFKPVRSMLRKLVKTKPVCRSDLKTVKKN